MVTEKLSEKHKLFVNSFNSGNDALDAFIKSDKAFDMSYGTTYVWMDDLETEIIGYYNISVGTFDFIDNGIRLKQCGAAHINCLAITEKFQGQQVQNTEGAHKFKLSDVILLDCINRINEIRNFIGIGCITLSSTDQGRSLYKRADFEDVEPDNCFTDTEGEKKTTDMYLILD